MDYKSLANKSVLEMSPYNAGKNIDELCREYGIDRFIRLSANENPYGAGRAGEYLEEMGISSQYYPESDSFYLRKAIADKFNISMDNILCGAGSDEIIQLLYLSFLNRSTFAVSPAPSFSEYESLARVAGSKCIWVDSNSDFSINFDNILKSVNHNTRFIMLANPNNPTGIAFSENDFISFMDKVNENVLVVLDEAYIEYSSLDSFSFSLLDKYRNLLILRTFSKAYGLASIRCGYLAADKECINIVNRVLPPFNVTAVAQKLCSIALDDNSFIEEAKKNNRKCKEYLYKELEALNISYIQSETNFILIKADIKDVGIKFMKKGILIREMTEDILKGYIRVTIGTMEECRKFIEIFKKIIANKV